MSAQTTEDNHRGIRFASLMKSGKLPTISAEVIGVGAIGRQVALMLAGLGVRRLDLWDFDTVNIENVGPQGYPEDSVGQSKVKVTGGHVLDVFGACTLGMHRQKWEPRSLPVTSPGKPSDRVSFVCLDSMAARKEVAEKVETTLLVDVRMASESFAVYTCLWELDSERYKETLYDDENAVELPCTNKATPYCANVGAGMAVNQFSKWLRGNDLEHMVLMNMTSMVLQVED